MARSTYFDLGRGADACPGSESGYAQRFQCGNVVKRLIWTGMNIRPLLSPSMTVRVNVKHFSSLLIRIAPFRTGFEPAQTKLRHLRPTFATPLLTPTRHRTILRSRPPVFTRRCSRLVSDQFSIPLGKLSPRGWLGYFDDCQTPSVLQTLESWLRPNGVLCPNSQYRVSLIRFSVPLIPHTLLPLLHSLLGREV
jgi:hypothetical protein